MLYRGLAARALHTQPAPNPLVLARAAAAPTRVSSDMPKESWVCAVRVKIAVGVQSAVHSEAHAPRWLHANLFAAHVRPRHRSPLPLHAPCMLAACIRHAKRIAHLQFGHLVLLAVATRRALLRLPSRGEVVVHRRDDVGLGCRTAPRTHSNMVKQKKRVRAALY